MVERTHAPENGASPGRPAKRPGRTARSAANFLPSRLDIASLRRASLDCKGCDLYRNATQTVFGEGPAKAAVVLIGEQPGDQEDRTGHPFVGPAGKLLERALTDAGIDRKRVYITNAVKHFKWIARGKRRLHQKPREGEIDACNPWLAAEITAIKPHAIVCMGVTAARAALGQSVRLKDFRGRITATRLSSHTLVTIHPSAILRLIGQSEREDEYRRFVEDLRSVKALI